MKKLYLKRIKCIDTQDAFRDGLNLKVYVDGRQHGRTRRKIMKDGDTWTINLNTVFKNKVVLRLYEWEIGRNSPLGQITIGKDPVSNRKVKFEPSPSSDYEATFSVKETLPVEADERALLIVSELSLENDLELLYAGLEDIAIKLPSEMLKNQYAQIRSLTGNSATAKKFVETLAKIAKKADIQAVDVILALHGRPEVLYFKDGAKKAAKLAEEIREALEAVGAVDKVRLLYSLACYGASHTDDFVDVAGFKVAVGATAVNANSVTEYPAFLFRWGMMGMPVDDSLNISQTLTRLQDKIAATYNESWDVNSHKLIRGVETTRITTPAD